MRKSTELNLSVDGFAKRSVSCPQINGIRSIDYDYDTNYKLAKIDLHCDSTILNLDKVMGAVIPNLPKDSREVRVNFNYQRPVTSYR